jgi:hypothetical protein
MHTITLTGYRRPHLFRETLMSLAANDLRGWRVSIRVEPSPAAPEFVAIAGSVLAGHDYSVVVNDTKLGVRDNPFRTIDEAFAQGSALNLCLEEDLLLAPDATALALWFARHHRPGWLCLCLMAGACGSAGPVSDSRHGDIVFLAKTFNSLGFAVRAEEWRAVMRPAWPRHQKHLSAPDAPIPPDGWDWSIYAEVVARDDLWSVQPAFARATHTGREGGTWCGPEFHDRAFAGLPLNAAPVRDFRLVDAPDLPHAVRAHLTVIDELTAARRALALAPRARRWFGGWR